MPPPPGGKRSGGVIAAVVAGAVAAVLLVVGGSVAIYTIANKKSSPTGQGSNRPSVPAGSAGAQGNGATNGTTNGPTTTATAKYDLKKIPENVCSTIDFSAFASLFETASGQPSSSRNLSTFLGYGGCTTSRGHSNGDTPISVATISFTVYVFPDPSTAVSGQDRALSDAKLNTNAIVNLTDVGETGFIYPYKSNTAQPGSDASYMLEARDGNLRVTAGAFISRIDDKSWSDAERRDIQQRLAAIAKASLAKTAAAMK